MARTPRLCCSTFWTSTHIGLRETLVFSLLRTPATYQPSGRRNTPLTFVVLANIFSLFPCRNKRGSNLPYTTDDGANDDEGSVKKIKKTKIGRENSWVWMNKTQFCPAFSRLFPFSFARSKARWLRSREAKTGRHFWRRSHVWRRRWEFWYG